MGGVVKSFDGQGRRDESADGIRMSQMKFFDHLGDVFSDDRGGFPRIILSREVFPFDQILNASAIFSTIQDFFDFVLLRSVDNNWRGWWLYNSFRKFVGNVGAELYH
jgi:hypothetical protein